VSEPRKEFLRGYLYAVLADGSLTGVTSPGAIVKKTIAMIRTDLPEVAGEVANTVAGNLVERGLELGLKWARGFADDIRLRGPAEVFRDFQTGRAASAPTRRR